MEVERVQRWVMSALLVTVAFIFAAGLALLSDSSTAQAGARPGLLAMAAIVGVLGIVGIRVIHSKPLLTPWLVVGLLPALLGWTLTR